MPPLDTASRLPDPDRAYRALIEAHRGLCDEESAALNTRLVLILANHIGDAGVLDGAIALARQAMAARGDRSKPRLRVRRPRAALVSGLGPEEG